MGRGSMMLTQQGMVFGTPEFMSPEQTQGEPLDRRSDIYSLALIFYELITGKLPFDATKPIDIMRAHLQDPPVPLNKRLPDKRFSVALESALAKALAKKPDDRYATAVEFAQALKACLTNPLATTNARRALPSEPAPPRSAAAETESNKRMRGESRASQLDPIEVPVSRGPLIAISVGLVVVLLVLGIWLGSSMQ
jgi:serine/threonine protein kinase